MIGTLTVDFETVELALYNLIYTQVSAAVPEPFKSESRTPQIFGSVDPSSQPFFALCGLGGTFINNQAAGLTVFNSRYFVQILAPANGSPYNPRTQIAPQTFLYTAMKAVIACVVLPFGQKQTLKGLVVETLMEEVKMDCGIIGNQTALELIFSAKIPIIGN